MTALAAPTPDGIDSPDQKVIMKDGNILSDIFYLLFNHVTTGTTFHTRVSYFIIIRNMNFTLTLINDWLSLKF